MNKILVVLLLLGSLSTNANSDCRYDLFDEISIWLNWPQMDIKSLTQSLEKSNDSDICYDLGRLKGRLLEFKTRYPLAVFNGVRKIHESCLESDEKYLNGYTEIKEMIEQLNSLHGSWRYCGGQEPVNRENLFLVITSIKNHIKKIQEKGLKLSGSKLRLE